MSMIENRVFNGVSPARELALSPNNMPISGRAPKSRFGRQFPLTETRRSRAKMQGVRDGFVKLFARRGVFNSDCRVTRPGHPLPHPAQDQPQ